MDAGGWILILVAAACVVALVIIAKKRKESEESISYGTDSDGDVKTDKPGGGISSAVEIPPQVTIYEYRSATKMKLCILCDGENDSAATHCRICGQQLK